VKEIPLSEIKPYWRNPRKISDEAVDAVAESIKRYGFNVPIVVDTKNVIISGHTRYKALMKLGYDTAPCVVVDLPPEKAKEYRLVDNKTNELTEWDWDKLSIELRELEEQDIKIFFPDLDELIGDSVGLGHVVIEDEKVYSQAEANEEMFKDRSEEREESLTEVVCPYCGETFYINKKDIK